MVNFFLGQSIKYQTMQTVIMTVSTFSASFFFLAEVWPFQQVLLVSTSHEIESIFDIVSSVLGLRNQ